MSESAKEKLRAIKTGRMGKTFEEIFGVEKAKEIKIKQRNAKLGTTQTEEHKLNIGKSRQGHIVTEKTRDKIHKAWEKGAFKNRKTKK